MFGFKIIREDALKEKTHYLEIELKSLKEEILCRNRFEKMTMEFDELHRKMLFYIGDYFHNFGTVTWFKEDKTPKDIVITPEIENLIAGTFMNIRVVSDISWNRRTNHIMSLLYLDNFSEEFIKEVKTYIKELEESAYSQLILKRLLFKLIISQFKEILPYVTNNNYSFDDAKPETITHLFSQKYTIP